MVKCYLICNIVTPEIRASNKGMLGRRCANLAGVGTRSGHLCAKEVRTAPDSLHEIWNTKVCRFHAPLAWPVG